MTQEEEEFYKDWLAAVDLGSNSFHMLIARVVDGELRTIDRIKEMVRLGGGLQEDNSLSQDAQERALETLRRFGERLRHMPQGSVRVVGTNTLRKARNTRGFLNQAAQALGHPIEIVSGREEGRLIYLGVAHGIFDNDEENRLVVDIGGGSTEVIIGRKFDVVACESLYMGCVSFSKHFFDQGKISAKRFKKATLAARQELRAIENRYPRIGWSMCLGASGTIKAAQRAVCAMHPEALTTSLEHLYELREHLISLGHVDNIRNLDIDPVRAPVIPGGLAVLIGVFESLGIEEMTVSDSAMREGVLYELYGRFQNKDVRELTIDNLAHRYHVDTFHAANVEKAAMALYAQVENIWEMSSDVHGRLLQWACRIHEIGLAIAHSRHHKHGSYLVENSEMAGFSRQDQQLLWALVRTHRRQFKAHRFEGLPDEWPLMGQRLCVLLRLAVLLNRSRSEEALPEMLQLKVNENKKIKIVFPDEWLEQAPLTELDLTSEVEYLAEAGFKLKFV